MGTAVLAPRCLPSQLEAREHETNHSPVPWHHVGYLQADPESVTRGADELREEVRGQEGSVSQEDGRNQHCGGSRNRAAPGRVLCLWPGSWRVGWGCPSMLHAAHPLLWWFWLQVLWGPWATSYEPLAWGQEEGMFREARDSHDCPLGDVAQQRGGKGTHISGWLLMWT